MNARYNSLDLSIFWGSLLPDGYCPVCSPEVHDFLGYGQTEKVFDKPISEGLHIKDGMRRAILDTGLVPRESPWKRFVGRLYPNGPVTIVPEASLSIKTLTSRRWKELEDSLISIGYKVQYCVDRNLKDTERQLRRSSLVIGPDVDKLHLADQMGVPVLGLYGVTRPERRGPLGKSSKTIHCPTGVEQIRNQIIVSTAHQMLGG